MFDIFVNAKVKKNYQLRNNYLIKLYLIDCMMFKRF